MGTFYRRRGKRAFDTTASAVLLLVLSPVLLAVALLVRLLLGAPVLFRQERSGLRGRPFALLKFRTMTDARDGEGAWLPDERRLTHFGRFLRRSSLDELPELWNVLRGEMSLVGPRPLLMRYLTRYTPQQASRQNVIPGITGLAQVDGRNNLSWDEKFRLDVTYVDSLSFTLDLRILLRTVRTVLSREGVSAGGCATMGEFMGQGSEPDSTTPAEDTPLAAPQEQDSMTKRQI